MKNRTNLSCLRNIPGVIMITALLLTCLSVQPVSAIMIELYVNGTTGSDAGPNDCQTYESPCKTINHAISQAGSGYRINIAAGTYTENIIVTNNISFMGYTRDTTILDGGGIGRTVSIFSGYTVSFIALTIQNGVASGDIGGGIYNAGDLTLNRVAVKNNSSEDGGGIFSTTHSLTLIDTVIQDNQATGTGSDYGGGIFIAGVNPVSITNSTISGNTATGLSGGIHIQQSSSVSFTNVTISGNTSAAGGGVTIADPASVAFLNSTIANNHLSSGTNGGGVYSGGIASFRNTIVAGNDANNCSIGGTWTSQGHNLDSGTTCNFTQTGDLQNSDPLLFALAPNGGFPWTHFLHEGSPAIDAGDDGYCPSTDARGSYRITRNHCDIGAVEMDNSAPTDISLSSTSVKERLPVGTTVGTLTTTDIDVLQPQTYSQTCTTPGVDDASFTIVGNALNTTAVFDYETKNSYAICIRTDDGNTGTYDKNFTINVTDLFEGTATIRSKDSQDGYLLESGENTNLGGSMDSASTTLRLGDDTLKKQYRSLLSFATSSLPDTAVITKVTLKVKRQGVIGGGNPVTMFQGFMLDIRKGTFGTLALQTSDFQTTGQKTVGPFTTALVGGWYSFDLTSAKAYINKLATLSGVTQIRLRFKVDDNNNTVANYLSLYSGNYAGAASRPTLVIEYYVP